LTLPATLHRHEESAEPERRFAVAGRKTAQETEAGEEKMKHFLRPYSSFGFIACTGGRCGAAVLRRLARGAGQGIWRNF
jgi:hypothetical protein